MVSKQKGPSIEPTFIIQTTQNNYSSLLGPKEPLTWGLTSNLVSGIKTVVLLYSWLGKEIFFMSQHHTGPEYVYPYLVLVGDKDHRWRYRNSNTT